MSKRIVLTGGGSGGHLFPLVAVADNIREQYGNQQELEFRYLGPAGKMEKEIMDRHNIPQRYVMSGKLRRYFSLHYILDILKFPIGTLQSAWHLFMFMPDVVYAKGGFASVPVALVARIFRIPVLIHESDALPGLANRFLGSIANRVAINFEKAKMFFPLSKTVITGIPVKSDSLGGDPQKAREFLKLPYLQKPVIFFIGGSQGAMAINQQVVDVVEELLTKYQVVHQTGKAHFEIICRMMREKGIDVQGGDYRPLAFIGEEMRDIFALADVVVSRAGANTIAEIAANKKPSILIPIAGSANNHQRVNAYEIAKAGATIVLEEENFKRGMLLYNLNEILTDENLKKRLSENIAQFYIPQANQLISDEIMKLVG